MTLEYALRAASRGWAVFPVKVTPKLGGGKKVTPIGEKDEHGKTVRGWRHFSTTDEATIRAWWAGEWRGASYGIDCGKAGLVVVDGDAKPDIDGVGNLRKLLSGHPTRLVVRTPGGGQHWYYATGDRTDITISEGELADGVDVRGDGGFVFGPGAADWRGSYEIAEVSGIPSDPWECFDTVELTTVPDVVRTGFRKAEREEQRRAEQEAKREQSRGARPTGEHDHRFTREEARAYVEGKPGDEAGLAAVRSAKEGARNRTAFRTALMLAKFEKAGFWTFLDAQKMIEECRTDWDDLDELRGSIVSAWGYPRDWTAELREEAAEGGAQVSGYEQDVLVELRKLRVRAEATRRHKAEQHATTWTPPTTLGTLADELLLPDPPVEWLVKDVFPAGANVVLTAEFKTGKTTLVNNLVRSLADGEPFLGKYEVTPPAGRIAIFNYELNPAQYRRWLRDTGIVKTERVVVLHLRGQRLPLVHPHIQTWVADWLRTNEVGAWILDPWARVLVGSAEENDNSTVGALLDTLDVIKEQAGVAELFMPSHTGRQEQAVGRERARGATRLDDWPDARWILTKGDQDQRFLRCIGRDVDEPEQRLNYDAATRHLTIGGGGRRAAKRDDLQRQVLAHLRDNPGATLNALVKATERRKVDVSAVVKSAQELGLIRIAPGARNASLHYLTEAGEATFSDHQPPLAPWLEPDPSVGI